MHTFMHSWILHAIQWIMNTFLRPVCVLYGLVNTSTTFDWGWSAIMLSRRAFITNLMLSSKVLWNVGSLIFAENSWILSDSFNCKWIYFQDKNFNSCLALPCQVAQLHFKSAKINFCLHNILRPFFYSVDFFGQL